MEYGVKDAVAIAFVLTEKDSEWIDKFQPLDRLNGSHSDPVCLLRNRFGERRATGESSSYREYFIDDNRYHCGLWKEYWLAELVTRRTPSGRELAENSETPSPDRSRQSPTHKSTVFPSKFILILDLPVSTFKPSNQTARSKAADEARMRW
ncbi:hypothetical protein C8R42DRAFT_645126 [Lentinula raphanica]|nr:hypothetical protein C8R42DRAFT_645126 [Lentinula raphanica]